MKKAMRKIHKHAIKIKKDSIKQIKEAITNALGLVIALSWNSAIQIALQEQKWLNGTGKVVYAMVVTIIGSLVIVMINIKR